MNIEIIKDQVALVYLTIETDSAFEVYGGTSRGAFGVCQTGDAQWLLTVSEAQAAAAAMRPFNVFARELATGREWRILDGAIVVAPRTTTAPGEKISPVEYRITVPVVEGELEIPGIGIAAGIPGPQGPKGDPGPPGEGGMTEEERATLAGAAQRGGDNTFTASNTFTGSVDMSTASVTPPEGWNVEGVTAEQVQSVVPIAFGEWTLQPDAFNKIGSIAIGNYARTKENYSIALGSSTHCNQVFSVAVGHNTQTNDRYSLSSGVSAVSKSAQNITIGFGYIEKVDNAEVTRTCSTEGTGSITIGAGANTLNTTTTIDGVETTVECSNAVTIGCKAENKGADSIVIGAQASSAAPGTVVLGSGAKGITNNLSVCIGRDAKTTSTGGVAVGANTNVQEYAVALGCYSVATKRRAIAIGTDSHATEQYTIACGTDTNATAKYTVALGAHARVSDYGATVISSTASDGTYTQLYFSGANTPLANTYENGEAMMGYVVRDSEGNVMTDAEGNAMVGTQKLSVLFPNNRGENAFTPAMLSMDEDWTPKPMFHPSDLDMPQEEPQEPEEYTPLPVWPIVEPEGPEELATGKE